MVFFFFSVPQFFLFLFLPLVNVSETHFVWLQILKLSYNKLTSVSPSLFEGLVGLIRLHLDHNLINFIEPYSFSGLTSLKLLQLEGNLLKEIHPHTFITVSLLGSFWTSGLR